MARARSTFGKLQRDQAKKDRAKAKMDDRLSRREDKAAASEQRGRRPVGRRGRPDPAARAVRRPPRGPGRRPDLAGRLRGTPRGAPGQARRLRSTPVRRLARAVGRVVAPLEPAPEPGRVGVDAVHGVELLLVRGVDVAEQRVEAGGQRVGDVLARRGRPVSAVSAHCRSVSSASARSASGSVEQAVVGQGDARRAGGPRTCRNEVSAWSRSKSGGGVEGRSTPPSGSRTPTASPAKSTPLSESCRPTWCLACPGESTATRTRSGPTADLLPVGEHVDALGRRGVEAAVERVEQRPVDPCRRVDEPGGVGQVARPLLVHVDGGGGKGPGHVAHPAGVVEVDVGHRHPGQLRRARPRVWSSASSSTGTELWLPGLDQHRAPGPSIR